MTWAEICALYLNEWVCLVELEHEHPTGGEVLTGRGIGHGKTRRDPVEQAMPWRDHYEAIAHYYTGKITGHPLRHFQVLDDETRSEVRRGPKAC